MSLRIECEHAGSRVIIPALVLEPSPSCSFDGHEGRALIDTGSTMTGIRQSVAKGLGLVGRGKRLIGGIGGEQQAERYVFRIALFGKGTAPTHPFAFDDVLGFELKDSFSFDVLLGMDILRQCDFELWRDGRGAITAG